MAEELRGDMTGEDVLRAVVGGGACDEEVEGRELGESGKGREGERERSLWRESGGYAN